MKAHHAVCAGADNEGATATAGAGTGVTPGDPGLYQVNVMAPPGITTGNSVPMQIVISGQSSQTNVTMALH